MKGKKIYNPTMKKNTMRCVCDCIKQEKLPTIWDQYRGNSVCILITQPFKLYQNSQFNQVEKQTNCM